jgi:hypothetical protein
MKKYLVILLALCWLMAGMILPSNARAASSGGGPFFTIYGVVQDQTVTVKLRNFPANLTYEVLLGPVETRGINGVKVATRNSGKGGTYLDMYTIPVALQGYYQIAIRVQRAANSGFIDDDVFLNHTGGTQPSSSSCKKYQGYPTFTILNVVQDQIVTVRAFNLPPENTFEVYMGLMGSRGVNGIKVATFQSICGDFPEYTFTIPAALHGLKRIAVRLQSITKPAYVAFNWFHNNTNVVFYVHAPHGITPPEPPLPVCPAYSGYPTFSILGVVRDQQVIIRAYNVPHHDQFRVLMGPMWTRGNGGIRVGDFDSDCGGMMDLTLPVPAALHGSYRISMRFESTTGSGYYAYNWFFNNTTP